MSECILRTENLTMQFGGVVAVDNHSIEVNRGEIVALIGPNGAGKTTMFNCITGVYEPTNGAVYFNDELIICNHPQKKMIQNYKGTEPDKFKTVMTKTPDQIAKLGIARTFQNVRLFTKLSVLENVLIAKHMRHKGNVFTDTFRINHAEELKMQREACELLDMFGLSDMRGDVAGSLPYGQQRRLEIARALATRPGLLLLDEPAAGMNPQETDELTAFISEIKDKFELTVLMIEHHMELVMEISDRLYVMDFGRLIAKGTPEVIQNDQTVIDAYLGVAEDDEQ